MGTIFVVASKVFAEDVPMVQRTPLYKNAILVENCETSDTDHRTALSGMPTPLNSFFSASSLITCKPVIYEAEIVFD